MSPSYFARGTLVEAKGDSNDLPHVPAVSYGRLRHAKSSSALQAIKPLYRRAPTLSAASGASRAALLSPISPNFFEELTPSSTAHSLSTPSPTVFSLTPRSPTGYSLASTSPTRCCVASPSPTGCSLASSSPTGCSLASPGFTAESKPVSPKHIDTSIAVPDNDYSFASKIRYRLSSATRKPVALPFLQISSPFRNDESKRLEFELKAASARQARSFSTSTSGNASTRPGGTKRPPYELQKLSSQTDLDTQPQKHSFGKTFFQDGLAKAHKKIFGSLKEDEEDQSDSSADEDEEDVNLIYSNVMIPLEFPTEEDEGNGFVVIPTVDQEHENDRIVSNPRQKLTSAPVQPSNVLSSLLLPPPCPSPLAALKRA